MTESREVRGKLNTGKFFAQKRTRVHFPLKRAGLCTESLTRAKAPARTEYLTKPKDSAKTENLTKQKI